MALRQRQPRVYRPWHGWLLLVVLLSAGGLGVARKFARTAPPTSDVPAVAWEEVQDPAPDATEGTVPGGEVSAPRQGEPTEPSSDDKEHTDEPTESPTDDSGGEPVLPEKINLAVPFTSQAPNGVWDALHEDACEEAAIYMVHEYFAGLGDVAIAADVADPALIDIVTYAETTFGYGLSITAGEVAALIEQYYSDVTAEIIENPTVDDLKKLLADGYPIIVPAAGRELGNPFFSGDGPLYHMLVLRGYDEEHFIANEPGTRHGRNYVYNTDVLMAAMGDWNNGDPVNGAHRVVVMKPAAN